MRQTPLPYPEIPIDPARIRCAAFQGLGGPANPPSIRNAARSILAGITGDTGDWGWCNTHPGESSGSGAYGWVSGPMGRPADGSTRNRSPGIGKMVGGKAGDRGRLKGGKGGYSVYGSGYLGYSAFRPGIWAWRARAETRLKILFKLRPKFQTYYTLLWAPLFLRHICSESVWKQLGFPSPWPHTLGDGG